MRARFRVWRSRRSAAAKAAGVAVEGLQPAAVEGPQPRLALHQVERGAALGAGLGERERPLVHVERQEPGPPREPGAGGPPVEPPGDHEVEGEVEVALEGEDEPLAEPPDPRHRPPLGGGQRRLGGAEQERAAEPEPPDHPAAEPGLQRLGVDGEIGELGHGGMMARPPRGRTSFRGGGRGGPAARQPAASSATRRRRACPSTGFTITGTGCSARNRSARSEKAPPVMNARCGTCSGQRSRSAW